MANNQTENDQNQKLIYIVNHTIDLRNYSLFDVGWKNY